MRTKWYYVLVLFIAGELLIAGLLYLYSWQMESAIQGSNGLIKQPNMIKGDIQSMEKLLYEYYEVKDGQENIGLEAGLDTFFLNGKSLTVLSGAIHYFRIHPKYWRDSLRKLRAMGANTVETYAPWNLHEPEKDVYDFGKKLSGTDYPFSEFLDVVHFIKLAREEDLFVIFRPGPYICSEWDFGGLPSYLLSTPGIKVRTNDPHYLERMDKFFDRLLPLVAPLQVHLGGPIIMFQVENEYASFVELGGKEHLRHIKRKMQNSGIDGLFVTSDGVMEHGTGGSLVEDGVLMTTNFQHDIGNQLMALKEIQPSRVVMVMEYWTGWFSHWGEKYQNNLRDASDYANKLIYILDFPSSVNLYMFQGGTNFGFMSGANQWRRGERVDYEPDITSYDYDALVSENGAYTKKYWLTREIFLNDQIPYGLKFPEVPPLRKTNQYPPIRMVEQMSYEDIIKSIPSEDRVESKTLMPMEMLPLKSRSGTGERGGQSYGYTLYRQICSANKDPEIQIAGRVKDLAIVLVDSIRQTDVITKLGQMYDFGFWEAVNGKKRLKAENGTHVFDFLLENMGRNNYGFSSYDFDQRKGLFEGTIMFDGEQPPNVWQIYTLDFQPKWVKSLNRWKEYTGINGEIDSPTMFKFKLDLANNQVFDTFIDMRGWGKGVVFINGFNIGRYFNIGPQYALYVPAPLLKPGENIIIVFENYKHPGILQFSSEPIFK